MKNWYGLHFGGIRSVVIRGDRKHCTGIALFKLSMINLLYNKFNKNRILLK